MRIGIIQASSQKEKNSILEACVKEVVPEGYEVINFGVFEGSEESISYVEIALCIGLLLESKSIDFMITGCSSGQGMMLACNSLPGVVCGYVPTVTDAYLFGRINNGNAVAYPLGLEWGWAAEINFKETIRALFAEPLGSGYPPKDAVRKKKDTEHLKAINRICKKTFVEVLPRLDGQLVTKAINYGTVYEYIMEHGTNKELVEAIRHYYKKENT